MFSSVTISLPDSILMSTGPKGHNVKLGLMRSGTYNLTLTSRDFDAAVSAVATTDRHVLVWLTPTSPSDTVESGIDMP